jgi:hypothetical protein
MPDLRPSGVPDLRFPAEWRRRDARIFEFLARRSATTAQLAAFFPGRTLAARIKKASRWVVRQRKRGRVRVVGVVQRRDTGRPEIVYGRSSKDLEHDVRITDLELLLGTPIQPGVKVGRTVPDGVMVRDGRRCFIEVDNSGKMTPKQMQAKWDRYRGVDGFILVVAVKEERMQRLRKGAEAVQDLAILLTTFDRLRAGQPWVDWSGDSIVI